MLSLFNMGMFNSHTRGPTSPKRMYEHIQRAGATTEFVLVKEFTAVFLKTW